MEYMSTTRWYDSYCQALSNTRNLVEQLDVRSRIKKQSLVQIRVPIIKKKLVMEKETLRNILKYGTVIMISASLAVGAAVKGHNNYTFQKELDEYPNFVARETHYNSVDNFYYNLNRIAHHIETSKMITSKQDFENLMYVTYSNFSYHPLEQINEVYQKISLNKLRETMEQNNSNPEEISRLITILANNPDFDSYLENNGYKDIEGLQKAVKDNFIKGK